MISARRVLCAAVEGRKLAVKQISLKEFSTAKVAGSMTDKFRLPARYGAGEKSVWVEYIQLAADYKPKLNLGQGFPDYHAPEHVTKALAKVTTSPDNPLFNQYTRGFGHPKLVQNLSKLYSPLVGRQIDPMNEVLVTAGAYEALYSTILGHVEDGDEVIIIEPFFDCYEPMVRCAGGVPKFIALKPKGSSDKMTSADWVLDDKELEAIFNKKTKMIIVNTPHNPVGKVFTKQELEKIADLCKKHNVLCVSDEVYEWMVFKPFEHVRIGDKLNISHVLCVSDEVYEWMVFKPFEHVRIATLPGMWERTITIGSAGKTFSVTGWKTGWAYGPANLLRNLQVVHQNCVYTHCTPIQEAVADALEIELSRWKSPECYMFSIVTELQEKRDVLYRILKENGFNPTLPDGGYFIMADWTKLANKLDLSSEPDKYKDYKFTKKFAKESGILTIPPSAFYSNEHKHLGENYARFCYIKKDENIALSEKLLKEWHKRSK